MTDSGTKKLLSRVADLEKENKKLRRDLSRYKKYTSKSVDLILDQYDRSNEACLIEKREKIIICEHCGKGETNRVKILDFRFDVCPICNHRKKIK
jgi:rubrerythrin